MKKFLWFIVIVALIAVGYVYYRSQVLSQGTTATSTVATTTATVISTAMYSCDDKKTISASYTNTAVDVTLSDGRQVHLPQVEAASGIRYETTIGSTTDMVFWSAGNNAFITEDSSTTYQDCIAGTVVADAGADTFTDATKTFSFSYPNTWSVTGDGGGYTQDWMVNATTSGMILAKIVVPASYLPGTNFADATFTVGTSADASAVASCLSYNPSGIAHNAATSTFNGSTYTVLQSSDAAAGNRYDTTSYRILRSSQCYAIEYTIHYGSIQNYPKGAVKEFDEAALKTTLDSVTQSFVFKQ